MEATQKQKILEDKIINKEFDVIWADELGSTNDESAKLALEGKENIVIADSQTSGSGRLGRSFESNKGGLYESIGICINDIFPYGETPDIGNTLHFPLICALSAMYAIEKTVSKIFEVDIIPDIKWPNDLLIKGKKISGILCKAVQSKGKWFIVCGIGINVFNKISDDLSDAANLNDFIEASVNEEKQEKFIIELACNLADGVIKNIKRGILDREKLLNDIEEHCMTIGKQVEVPARNIKGYALQIGDDGSLCIDTGDGEFEIIKSGDVVIFN